MSRINQQLEWLGEWIAEAHEDGDVEVARWLDGKKKELIAQRSDEEVQRMEAVMEGV